MRRHLEMIGLELEVVDSDRTIALSFVAFEPFSGETDSASNSVSTKDAGLELAAASWNLSRNASRRRT